MNTATNQTCRELRNGVRLPLIGYGTYLADNGAEDVRNAIRAGYRLIDCAAKYGNEAGIGTGLATCGTDRSELLITSKVWSTERGYQATLRSFDNSLKALGLEYLDLYLIHWPASPTRYPDWQQINLDTWRALEHLYRQGKVRAIGVSNFMPHHLEPLMQQATVLPMVNQIEYHPGFRQSACVDYCRSHDILVQAWSPLGRRRVLDNDALKQIADCCHKSTAQVCLRWEVQNGIVPLPKSVNPERMRENIDIFDFSLTPRQMQIIDSLPEFGESGLDPDSVDF